jgi:hypothetical protein
MTLAKRIAIAGLASVIVSCAVYLTRYEYFSEKIGENEVMFRTNRWTNETDMLTIRGWHVSQTSRDWKVIQSLPIATDPAHVVCAFGGALAPKQMECEEARLQADHGESELDFAKSELRNLGFRFAEDVK